MASPSTQRGNIFFYILIGIVLFAALTYAMSRSSVGVKDINDEKARLAASEIITYGLQVKDGVSKLRLRGCTEGQLDFTTSMYTKISGAAIMPANTNSPSNDTCDVFSASGAGINPSIAPALSTLPGGASTSLPQLGHGSVYVFQQSNVGTDAAAGTASANELVFALNWIDTKVCLKINDMLGVTNASTTAPPTMSSLTGVGAYTNGAFTGSPINSAAGTVGKTAFCATVTSEGNRFYQVLLAR